MAEEWDVFQMLPGDDAPVLLATLYEASQKTIRVELNGTGSGSFAINRTSPECTEAILAQGNLVKVRIPEIHTGYIFAFFLETGDFTLISSQEEGGEMLTFGGRGILSYLDYAQAWSASYIDGGEDPIAGVWRAYNAGTGNKPGQILRRLLEEFQDADRPQQPVPLLTIDFDYDDDSASDPWDATDATAEFSYQVGERGFAIVERLLQTETIRVQMTPDFLLQAWNVDQFGRDLTGDDFGPDIVRFERGVNIATELRRQLQAGQSSLGGGGGVPETHMLAQGENDKYGSATLDDAADRVTREGFIAAFGTGTTALNGIAASEGENRVIVRDTLMFPIANRRTSSVVLSDPVSIGSALGPVATDGFYLPGPEGTNGDFWVGDLVRVHTGTGPFDYDETDWRVEAITISRDDDNAELIVIPELRTPVIPQVFNEQFGSSTEFSGCELFTWPEGPPADGNLLIGGLAQRAVSEFDSDITPIGNTSTLACDGDLDVAGTDYTFINGLYVNTNFSSDRPGYPISMAWREASGDPVSVRWGGLGGLSGTSRPRSHQAEIEITPGAPSVTATSQDVAVSGATFTSPNIAAGAAGYIFWIMGYNCSGPADGASASFSFSTATANAHILTQGFQYSSFGGYSAFGYRYVSAAGTYNVVLDRSAAPRAGSDYAWIMGFWAAGTPTPGFPA